MHLDDLRTLLDYHYWARDRVLAAAGRLTPEQFTRDLGNSFPSVRDTLVHMYGAEWVWLSRWEGQSPTALPESSPYGDVAGIQRAWIGIEAKIRAFVERLGEHGMSQPMHYRGFNGQEQAQLFFQMLQHLVNHGSYHRGQLTTMMRQMKVAPPPSTDLITFYRERAAAQR